MFGLPPHANPTVHEGSWAELIAVPESKLDAEALRRATSLRPAPPHSQASPRWRRVDALALSEGETILIVGATGGVGSLAVQLAARSGATVVAPALPEDEDYLRDLGVSRTRARDGDSRRGRASATLTASTRARPRHLRAGIPDGACQGRRPRRLADRAPPVKARAAPTSWPHLRLRICGGSHGLLSDGSLRVPVQATYDLAQAPEALTALAASHTRANSLFVSGKAARPSLPSARVVLLGDQPPSSIARTRAHARGRVG